MSGIIILGSAGLAKEFYYYIKRACPYITDYIFVNDLDDGQTTLDIDGKIFEVIKDSCRVLSFKLLKWSLKSSRFFLIFRA